MTADFTKNIRKENPDFTAEIITQFHKFLQELEVKASYFPAEDSSHTDNIMWQETVETLALKYLSFMGIITDKSDENTTPDIPFLTSKGIFFGIQKFIFSDVNNTEKMPRKFYEVARILSPFYAN